MKSNRWTVLYIIGVIYIFSSCANRVTPSGGKKDEKQPAVQSMEPPNYSKNFKGRKVEITFDEYVQLMDLQKQLIISPLIDPQPSINVKKKSLVIALPENLKVNTTYTFNFGNAITDIHENNAIESFQYVFSTGEILDSLYCKGKAVDALKKTGEKGICILLYHDIDDSLPLKSKPDYFARTNENGEFRISNIGAGQYMLVAVNDKNSNYICDSPKEEAISLSQIIVPDSNAINLDYFIEQPSGLYIKKTTYAGDRKWNVMMNKSSDSASFSPLNDSQPIYLEAWSMNRDTAFIWCSDTVQDTLYVKLLYNQVTTDTLRLQLATPKTTESKGRGGTVAFPAKYNFIEGYSATNGLRPFTNLEISLKNPIINFSTDKLVLTEDSVKIEKFSAVFSDSLKRKLIVMAKWKEESRYELTMLPGAVTDFMGITNDTIRIPFLVRNISEFGTLQLNLIEIPKGNLLLQLLKSEAGVIQQMKVSAAGKYDFKAIDPAKYRLCIVVDRNGNGRWDTGNYLQKLPPEEVYYYDSEITIRANWDMEQEWKVIHEN